MRKLALFATVLALISVPVLADATADARKLQEAFAKAFNSGDQKAIVAMYADDARVVWPGAGEEGKGKAAIAGLVKAMMQMNSGATLELKSIEAIPLGNGYVATVCRWEESAKGPDGKTEIFQIRSTELLRKAGSRMLYVVDHASIGLPPPEASH